MKRLVIFCALGACCSGGAAALDLPVAGASVAVPVTSIREARFRTTLRQQYDFSCGSAALATLLSYHYDYPVSEKQVFEAMFAQGDQDKIRREGFSLLDMKRYLAQRGFEADGFQLPLQKLADAGYPAIVLVAERGYHHFVVVKGIDGGRVLLGDPSGGTRAMSRAAFEAIWLNQLQFVIHRWPGAMRFNQRADWRVAPRPMLGDAISRASLADITLPKNGGGNY